MDNSNAAKRSKLEELANKKRKEQEEALEQERQQRLKKIKETEIDFGSDSDDEGIIPSKQVPRSGANTQDDAPQPPLEITAVADEEEDQAELVPTDADLAFIDDDDVPLDEQVDFADDGNAPFAFDEAEEAAEDIEDELDRIFTHKKRGQSTGTDAENRATVENLLAQMEAAAEKDLDASEHGKPAVHKLRMLGRVEEVLAIKKLHGELLDSGLLSVLKVWIDMMPDGSLPNSKIRSSILNILTKLPIDCAYEDRREQLKRSGVGKIVMFLSKVSDETPENKKTARGLVERWSRPLLAPQRMRDAVDEEEAQRIFEARKQRALLADKAERNEEAEEDGGQGAALRPGQPGYRFHAAIPQAASLDYIKAPESKVMMVDKKGSSKGGDHKLTKKLNTMGKKVSSRAANVSVEGRNVNFANI